jgi:DNA polymerase theta
MYYIHTHTHTHIYMHTILKVVVGEIVQTTADIHRYVKCTISNVTKPFEDVEKAAQESLRWL